MRSRTPDPAWQLRAAALVRAGWGCALLAVPQRVLRIGGRGAPPARAVTVARVLGARQVAQALVIAARPSPRVAGLSVLVDAAHASTCVWLAVTSGRWRPTATVDALIAVGLAAAGWQARKAR